MLPDILEDLPKKLKENEIIHILIRYMIVIIVWFLPYGVASIPFLIFFYPNRHKWYDKHSFHGIDWDMEK